MADDTTTPQFAFETKRREAVETAGARIGLAQTFLVIDGHGTYRVRQEYRVDNKTEQYLEVQLPEGAQLWTVRVAGEAVKPTTTQQSRQVLIPLLKTATGDLDYPVELKYGGRLPGLRTIRPIDFPLPRTVNINVELSQVRLYLPDTHYWFGFDGTLRRVKDEGELVAGFLSYRTKQIRALTETLSSGTNEFERMRSANNLKQLGLALQNYHHDYAGRAGGVLQEEIDSNGAAMAQAEQKLNAVITDGSASTEVGNRDRLLSRYQSQEVARSKGKVTQLGENFRTDVSSPATPTDGENRFNSGWFKGVEAGTKAPVADDKSRISEGRPMSQSQRRSSLVVGQELNGNEAEARGGLRAGDEMKRLADLQQPVDQPQPSDQAEQQQRVERYRQKLDQQSAQQSYGGYAVIPQQPASGPVDLFGEAGGFGRACRSALGWFRCYLPRLQCRWPRSPIDGRGRDCAVACHGTGEPRHRDPAARTRVPVHDTARRDRDHRARCSGRRRGEADPLAAGGGDHRRRRDLPGTSSVPEPSDSRSIQGPAAASAGRDEPDHRHLSRGRSRCPDSRRRAVAPSPPPATPRFPAGALSRTEPVGWRTRGRTPRSRQLRAFRGDLPDRHELFALVLSFKCCLAALAELVLRAADVGSGGAGLPGGLGICVATQRGQRCAAPVFGFGVLRFVGAAHAQIGGIRECRFKILQCGFVLPFLHSLFAPAQVGAMEQSPCNVLPFPVHEIGCGGQQVDRFGKLAFVEIRLRQHDDDFRAPLAIDRHLLQELNGLRAFLVGDQDLGQITVQRLVGGTRLDGTLVVLGGVRQIVVADGGQAQIAQRYAQRRVHSRSLLPVGERLHRCVRGWPTDCPGADGHSHRPDSR